MCLIVSCKRIDQCENYYSCKPLQNASLLAIQVFPLPDPWELETTSGVVVPKSAAFAPSESLKAVRAALLFGTAALADVLLPVILLVPPGVETSGVDPKKQKFQA